MTKETDFSHDPFFAAFNEYRTRPEGGPRQELGHAVPSTAILINKRVHQFWLGSVPLPELYVACRESNRQLLDGTDIELRLYTDADIDDILDCAQPQLRAAYEVIPRNNLACKKDLLMAAVLHQEGGLGIDCSMYLRDVGNLFGAPVFATRYRYFLGDKSRLNFPFAVPCQFGFIACAAGSELTAELLDGIQRFWLEDDHLRLAKLYTTKDFPDPQARHGWMCQYYLNESIYRRVTDPDTNYTFDFMFSWDRYVLDIDTIQTAYSIKHLITHKFDRERFEALTAGKP